MRVTDLNDLSAQKSGFQLTRRLRYRAGSKIYKAMMKWRMDGLSWAYGCVKFLSARHVEVIILERPLWIVNLRCLPVPKSTIFGRKRKVTESAEVKKIFLMRRKGGNDLRQGAWWTTNMTCTLIYLATF